MSFLNSDQGRSLTTGCNDHMTSNFDSLESPSPCACDSSSVKLPNGNNAHVTHLGSVRISNKFHLRVVLNLGSIFFLFQNPLFRINALHHSTHISEDNGDR